MDCTGLLVVLASAIYSVTSQTQSTVTTSGGGFVSVGDTAVKLTCTVTKLDAFTYAAMWIKEDLKNKDKFTVISSHQSIVALESINYELEPSGNAEEAIYTLVLNEIRLEEDGFYRCVLVKNTNPTELLVQSREELKVRQPITSLELNAGSIQVSATEGENTRTVELEKFDPDLVVGCMVKGSNPEPRIELSVGGQSILNEVLRQDQVNINGKKPRYYRNYDTDLDSTGKKSFDDSIIGKEITCTAWMEDGTPDQANAMTATIIITLKEPPKVQCSDVTTRLADRRVTMTCIIESLVKPMEIKWYIIENGEPLFIPANGAYHEEYIANQKDLGDNKYEVTLEIGQVEEKHFGNEFTLEAVVPGNDISHVVRLQKSVPVTPKGETVDGGVGQVSMTVTFLMCSMMIGCLMRKLI